jgi:hypothetical protein
MSKFSWLEILTDISISVSFMSAISERPNYHERDKQDTKEKIRYRNLQNQRDK